MRLIDKTETVGRVLLAEKVRSIYKEFLMDAKYSGEGYNIEVEYSIVDEPYLVFYIMYNITDSEIPATWHYEIDEVIKALEAEADKTNLFPALRVFFYHEKAGLMCTTPFFPPQFSKYKVKSL